MVYTEYGVLVDKYNSLTRAGTQFQKMAYDVNERIQDLDLGDTFKLTYKRDGLSPVVKRENMSKLEIQLCLLQIGILELDM